MRSMRLEIWYDLFAEELDELVLVCWSGRICVCMRPGMEMVTTPYRVKTVLLGLHSKVQQLTGVILLMRSVEAKP